MSFLPPSTTESSVCASNRCFHTWITDAMVFARDSSLRESPVSVFALNRWKPLQVLSQRWERVQRPSLRSFYCYWCCPPESLSTEFRPIYPSSGDHDGSTLKGIARFFRCRSPPVLSFTVDDCPPGSKVDPASTPRLCDLSCPLSGLG
jgi:hypothetical protein